MKLLHFYVNKADLLKASMKIKGFFRFIFKKIALGHPLFFNGISSAYSSILLTMRLQFLFAIEKPLAEVDIPSLEQQIFTKYINN